MKKLLSFIAVTVTAATAVAAGAYIVKKLEEGKDEEVKLIEIINEEEPEKKTKLTKEENTEMPVEEEPEVVEDEVESEVVDEPAQEQTLEEVVEEVIAEEIAEPMVEEVEDIIEPVTEAAEEESEIVVEDNEEVVEEPIEESEIVEEKTLEETEEVVDNEPEEVEELVEETMEEIVEEEPSTEMEPAVVEEPVEEYSAVSDRKKTAIRNQIQVMLDSMEDIESIDLQHYIVFPNAESSDACLAELEDCGYEIEVDNEGTEVNLTKHAELNYDSLEKEILSLAQVAAIHTGVYKGWAVKVNE